MSALWWCGFVVFVVAYMFGAGVTAWAIENKTNSCWDEPISILAIMVWPLTLFAMVGYSVASWFHRAMRRPV